MMAAPATAGECAYENQNGQKIDWRGGDTVTFDPLYTDAVTCSLAAIENTNGFTANCGSWSQTLVIGASTAASNLSDIVVWGNVFYWLKCEKDGA